MTRTVNELKDDLRKGLINNGYTNYGATKMIGDCEELAKTLVGFLIYDKFYQIFETLATVSRTQNKGLSTSELSQIMNNAAKDYIYYLNKYIQENQINLLKEFPDMKIISHHIRQCFPDKWPYLKNNKSYNTY